MTFREACEYADGGRVWVETTLEVRGGKIVRQTDLVAQVARARDTTRRLPSSEQEIEKED